MAVIPLSTTADVRAAEKLNKTLAKTDDQLEQIVKSGRGAAGAAERLARQADPLKRLESQVAKVELATRKQGLATRDADVLLQKYTRSAVRAQQANEGSFGQAALARVTSYAAGLVSLSSVASALLGVLSKIRDAQKAVAEAQIAGTAPSAKLVQLAGGDPKLRKTLEQAADVTFAEGFVTNRDAAKALTFELGSSGTLGDRAFFSRLALIDDAALLAKQAGLIRSGFAGGDEVGSSQEIISKAIAAALPATGVSPSDIAEGVATAASFAKGFEFSDEELTAAVSRTAEVVGSGSEAGNRVRRLLAALTREGLADKLKGQSLESVISHVQGLGLSQEEQVKFLGSVEASQAYDILTDRGALQKRIAEIEEAQSGGLADATIRNALGDNRTRAGIFARRGRARNLLSQDDQAVAQNEFEGWMELWAEKSRRAGESETDIAINRWVYEKQAEFLGPEAVTNNRFGRTGGTEMIEYLLKEQTDILRQQGASSGRQE